MYLLFGTLLVFCRKDLCEAKHEMESVFKFSDVLFAPKSDGPPVVEVSGQADLWSDVPPWYRHLMAKFGTTSGQADHWSDVLPGRDIL